MFKNRAIGTSMGLALGSGLFLALLWALGSGFPVVRAQGPDGYSVYYVAPSCTGLPTPCFNTVQAAVDAADAPGDVIKVAAGTYQVVHINKTVTIRGGYTTAFADPPNPDVNLTTLDAERQERVIYITGNISPTLEGLRIVNGLTTGNGSGIYVAYAHPVISGCQVLSNIAYANGGGLYLDHSNATLIGNTFTDNSANYGGDGLYLFYANATLSRNNVSANRGDGLYLSYSNATLNENTISANYGCGLYLTYSDATLISNTVFHNIATGGGGGLHLYRSNAMLIGNIVSTNVATGTRPDGGGLYLDESAATLNGNTVCCNTAANGGGLYLHLSDAALNGNTVCSNTASSSGGGLYLDNSDAILNGNTVYSNTARSSGGGLLLSFSDATLSRNIIYANTATGAWSGHGGGLYLSQSDATLVNNFVTDNALTWGHGSGLYVHESSPQLRHNTIAHNHGGGGEGLYVTDGDRYRTRISRPQLHNTILVSHSIGISVTGNSSAQLEGTLWGSGVWSNTIDWVGNVTTGTVNIWGDPAFVNPDGGNYHINTGSVAIDSGVYPTLSDDVDGEPRPAGFGPDIGADEHPGPGLQLNKQASQSASNPGQTVTYTLAVTAGGTEPVDNVILTDTLPLEQHITAYDTSVGSCTIPPPSAWGGQVRCTLGTLNVSDSVHITITVQVATTVPPTPPWMMRNSAWVTGTQASSFAYTDVYLQDCHVRLNDGTAEWDNVQAAVDASTGPTDVVKVAGTCTGINARGGVRQVVYISKTVTIRGGYSPANWTTPDPDVNPTTLDAIKQGRVIYIAGNVSPTLEGLQIANGLAIDHGGGIYIASARPVISGCRVLSNTACGDGGGLYLLSRDVTLSRNTVAANIAGDDGGGLYSSNNDATIVGNTISANDTGHSGGGLCLSLASPNHITLSDNTISANDAQYGGGVYLVNHGDAAFSSNTVSANTASYGGGLYLYYTDPVLSGNAINANIATHSGGGVYMDSSDATLSSNIITTNTAGTDGGGLYLGLSDATLSGNTVAANAVYSNGGGLYLYWSAAMLSGNIVSGNSAVHNGGGLYLYCYSDTTLTNTVVADNLASTQGSGLYIHGSSPRLLHSTIARNSGGDGSGVHVTRDCCGYSSTIALTNTILVSHTVGITVAAGNTATLEATLWGSGAWANSTNWGGSGRILTGTGNIRDDPAFVNPDGGDYHIGSDSAAIDAGVHAGVTNDIDRDPRLNLPDIGADEFILRTYLPLVMHQYP